MTSRAYFGVKSCTAGSRVYCGSVPVGLRREHLAEISCEKSRINLN